MTLVSFPENVPDLKKLASGITFNPFLVQNYVDKSHEEML